MKSKMFKKLMAAVIATTMTASLAACGNGGEGTDASGSSASGDNKSSQPSSDVASSDASSSEDELGAYTPLKDANGNVYDLGGMEIVIRDWWSPSDGVPAEPKNAFEEARAEYREWIQETYNFKICEMAISDWGSAPQDFVDYVSSGGDSNNYVFTLRNDPALISAMATGLCYDLSTLDCLDFNSQKHTANLLHKQFSKGGKIFAMYAGASEPRTGVFFNKRLLKEAGIDPETIYDMQKNGTWTWDALIDLCDQVQQDTNNDGEIDVYACNCNNGVLTEAAVYSNGGEFVGQDASGKYVYKLEDANTLEGLEFAKKLFDNYWEKEPEGAAWDYYKEGFLNGEYVFCFDQAYCAQETGPFYAMADDFGFVMFPKGPQAKDYTNCWDNNPACIPACYDADRAWKIAFAWNLYTNDVPGYENSDAWKAAYYSCYRDTRSVDETLAMMRTKGMITFHGVIPNLAFGPELTWKVGPGSAPISETVGAIADTWKSYINDANK
ncbi:MAG: carbohydrate ABC transporter substrate-binding protein [Lachnospiraceae bacterium]|nr:carbohydrate ABC transporter substrate-binding protein [Lachnospiraceae bacterium]